MVSSSMSTDRVTSTEPMKIAPHYVDFKQHFFFILLFVLFAIALWMISMLTDGDSAYFMVTPSLQRGTLVIHQGKNNTEASSFTQKNVNHTTHFIHF